MSKLQFGQPTGKTVEYLEQYFTNSTRSGYVTCIDTLLPENFTNFGEKIYEMKIRSDDIWVCSFPRTGTTWTQEMVWCIAHDVDLKNAKTLLLSERFPFLESSIIFNVHNLPRTDDPEYSDLMKNSVDHVINLESPRFIKSHLPFKLLPKELQQNKAKIIYVTRNPRDACISSFHHRRKFGGYTGTFEQYCELFLEGNVLFGPFWNHVQSFWENRDKTNVLILKYEDMIKDLKSVVYKVANFLEKSLSDEQVTKLLDHLSFDKMKNNSATNGEAFNNLMNKYGLLPEKYEDCIRSGKIGEWKKVMNTKLVQRFQTWQQENLKNADESLVRFFDM